jgi:hypothetical protein
MSSMIRMKSAHDAKISFLEESGSARPVSARRLSHHPTWEKCWYLRGHQSLRWLFLRLRKTGQRSVLQASMLSSHASSLIN